MRFYFNLFEDHREIQKTLEFVQPKSRPFVLLFPQFHCQEVVISIQTTNLHTVSALLITLSKPSLFGFSQLLISKKKNRRYRSIYHLNIRHHGLQSIKARPSHKHRRRWQGLPRPVLGGSHRRPGRIRRRQNRVLQTQ